MFLVGKLKWLFGNYFCYKVDFYVLLRIISKWLNCLAGPKALTSQLLQTNNPLIHDLCLEMLTVHCNKLRLIFANAFPLLTLYLAYVRTEEGKTFNDSSCDAVLAEKSTPSQRMCYVFRCSRSCRIKLSIHKIIIG